MLDPRREKVIQGGRLDLEPTYVKRIRDPGEGGGFTCLGMACGDTFPSAGIRECLPWSQCLPTPSPTHRLPLRLCGNFLELTAQLSSLLLDFFAS